MSVSRYTTVAVLSATCLTLLLLRRPPDRGAAVAKGNVPVVELPFVLVLCKGSSKPHFVSDVPPQEMQERQVDVLLKSAAVLTRRTLTFILVCDNFDAFQRVISVIRLWPPVYQSRLHLQYRPVYTPDLPGILELYDKCAAERLFLPWILPDIDSAVFLDTDIFFMRPPEDLLEEFKNFNSTHVFAMPSNPGFYTQRTTSIPYPQPIGVADSLLMANLTRWRTLSWSWPSTVAAVYHNFKTQLTTGDQDILNIILSEFPETLYTLSCSWQGVIAHCLMVGWECEDVKYHGFSAVHGARWRFFRDKHWGSSMSVIPLRVLFRAWETHHLDTPVSSLLQDVLQVLHALQEVARSNTNQTDSHVFCMYDIRKVFMQLQKYIDTHENKIIS